MGPYTQEVGAVGLTYQRARAVLLFAGLGLIGIVALVALWRGVDPVEVSGTLLFIPIFVGFLLFGIRGGLTLAAVSSLGYLALRMPAISLVGFDAMAGQITARVLGYLGFAAGGGWALDQIRQTLERLELRDDTDDETGLGNARSVLEAVDLERARADRYLKVFSVVAADFVVPDWADLSLRKQRTILRDLGSKLQAAVRASDHVAHTRRGDHHIIGLVLPETSAEGARIVTDNLKKQLTRLIAVHDPRVAAATYPGDEEQLAAILELFTELDRSQRSPAT
jgi:hypothetical protein